PRSVTFTDVHREQGQLLAEEGVRIGVVRTIAGTAHLEVVVRGQPDHAGATAMDRRRDALLGASAMVLAIAEVARDMFPAAVATVGTLGVEPAQVNEVPGVARITVDARHSDNSQRALLVV